MNAIPVAKWIIIADDIFVNIATLRIPVVDTIAVAGRTRSIVADDVAGNLRVVVVVVVHAIEVVQRLEVVHFILAYLCFV